MFKKLIAWFHRHPGIKTAGVAIGGAALSAAGSGVFGPKGAAVASTVGALTALFIKRPQDTPPPAPPVPVP